MRSCRFLALQVRYNLSVYFLRERRLFYPAVVVFATQVQGSSWNHRYSRSLCYACFNIFFFFSIHFLPLRFYLFIIFIISPCPRRVFLNLFIIIIIIIIIIIMIKILLDVAWRDSNASVACCRIASGAWNND